jgi:hypothetical protein
MKCNPPPLETPNDIHNSCFLASKTGFLCTTLTLKDKQLATIVENFVLANNAVAMMRVNVYGGYKAFKKIW